MKNSVFYLLLFIAFSIQTFAETHLCTFCDPQIITTQSVYETDLHVVLLDHSPRATGHLLVVPKRHVVQADGMTAEEWLELSVLFPKCVEVFKKAFNTDQYIVLQKNGPKAFQNVFHVHFHLFPMQSNTWADVFDVSPQVLSKEVFEEQLTALRACFLMD